VFIVVITRSISTRAQGHNDLQLDPLAATAAVCSGDARRQDGPQHSRPSLLIGSAASL
jgi:hypothetical protein